LDKQKAEIRSFSFESVELLIEFNAGIPRRIYRNREIDKPAKGIKMNYNINRFIGLSFMLFVAGRVTFKSCVK